jgi:hypothetical protein
MAYLESRLEGLKNNLVAPAREPGLKALEGQNISEFYGVDFFTVPQYHHGFKHLRDWMNELNRQVFFDIHHTVINHCKVKIRMLHGNSIIGSEDIFKKCVEETEIKMNLNGDLEVTIF